MNIYYTDKIFSELDNNPYNNGKPYDDSWILLRLIDNNSFSSKTGNDGNKLFQFVLSKSSPQWQYQLMDFIAYESEWNKNIIVAADETDIENARSAYGNHSYKDKFLRDYETRFLVHTTTKEAYKKILESGCLKSWNTLKAENAISDNNPIGQLLGDPKDYSDYVMLNNGEYFTEIVVLSKQRGKITMDIHAEYEAGARLYFDAAKIAEDGLLVRDGAHLKVQHKLLLEKYLIWTATPEILGLSKVTTPYEFGTMADKMFQKNYCI